MGVLRGRPRTFLVGACVVISAVAAGIFALGVDRLTKTKQCTLIGCTSGVSVQERSIARAFPEADSMRLCVEDLCEGHDIGRRPLRSVRSLQVRNKAVDGPEPVTVRLTLFDAQERVMETGSTEVTLSRYRPNGPGCGNCWNAGVRFDRTLDRLVQR